MQINTLGNAPRITALLGPTNTGKTYFALERMLAHASGMIGFPLRLLARENYDRAVRMKGKGQVALITGEEKIVPEGARYFFCTVESMPLDRAVDFLAVDEIQMAGDPERGHVFTDRLLNARGRSETMFMGADTIRAILGALVPGIEFVSRPRFSTLAYTGAKKITRLKPRSAVVAFSAAEVYRLAESIRRHAGGAAVVMGALSPRTRNAQVAMYQAGEVDYLVATDAIGMGLNMDVDHVALAGTRKFDGRMARNLTPPELAQIAGRAGRHMNDGTFGTTADAPELDEETVAAIEEHRFESLKTLQWRNPALDFSSLDAFLRSLAARPPLAALARAREADDERVLQALLRDEAVARTATNPAALRLLWDVAQVPDFASVMSDAHADLLRHIYLHLVSSAGKLPNDWVAAQVTRLERTDGPIEALMTRLSAIRTWTYVAFQVGWMDDATHWQERTRMAEDTLSDTLHDRLVQRFVDKRTAELGRGLRDGAEMTAAVDADGRVSVAGHDVGRLEGFRFAPDVEHAGGNDAARRTVTDAALKALRAEVEGRLQRLAQAADTAISLRGADVLWEGARIARLAAGRDALNPVVHVLESELLEAVQKDAIGRRLDAWLAATVAARMTALVDAMKAEVTGAARGLLFQMAEGLGSVRRRAAIEQINALSRDDRKTLRQLGVRIGREAVYFPALLKANAIRLRASLFAAHAGGDLAALPEGRVRVELEEKTPRAFYEACGFRPLRTFALRIDMLERIASRAFALNHEGKGVIWDAGELMSLAGAGADALEEVMSHIGYRKAMRTKPPAPEPAPAPEATAEAAPEPAPEPTAEAVPEAAPPAEGGGEPVAVYVRGRVGHAKAKHGKPFSGAKEKSEPRKDPAKERKAVAKDGPKDKPKGKFKGNFKGGPKRDARPWAEARAPKTKEPDPDSPFYKLKDLIKR